MKEYKIWIEIEEFDTKEDTHDGDVAEPVPLPLTFNTLKEARMIQEFMPVLIAAVMDMEDQGYAIRKR